MGHTDTKHRKLDLGHQVRSLSELTSQSIEGSDALRSPAHNQCINTHSFELLQRSRRRHQARVYSQLLESPSYQVIVLAFDVDNGNSCQATRTLWSQAVSA